MRYLALTLLVLSSAVLADLPGYDLSLGAEVRGGTLKVEPVITAPAGAKLRYDVTAKRAGSGGNSNSRQGGSVTVGEDGKAELSQMSVSVGGEDRYEVTVEVYDGERLVAARTLRHPD